MLYDKQFLNCILGKHKFFFQKKICRIQILFRKISLNVHNFITQCRTRAVLWFCSLWHSYGPDGLCAVSELCKRSLFQNPTLLISVLYGFITNGKEDLHCNTPSFLNSVFLLICRYPEALRETGGSQKSNAVNYS